MNHLVHNLTAEYKWHIFRSAQSSRSGPIDGAGLLLLLNQLFQVRLHRTSPHIIIEIFQFSSCC